MKLESEDQLPPSGALVGGGEPRPLRPYSAGEFANRPNTERESLLGEWFLTRMPLLVSGAPKSGKSFFSYFIAGSIASGLPYLGWRPGRPRRVGILDGEMDDSEIKERIALMRQYFSLGDEPLKENLLVLSSEMFSERNEALPSLRDPGQRKRLLNLFKDVDLIVVDNVNIWFPGEGASRDENGTAFWGDVERFLMEAKRAGISILLVHHASKSSKDSPSGSSKNERFVEGSIVLTKTSEEAVGANFDVKFRCLRRNPPDTQAFSAQLVTMDDAVTWYRFDTPRVEQASTNPGRKIDNREEAREKVSALKCDGVSMSDIATEMGISRPTVYKLMEEAKRRQPPAV